MAAPAEPDGGAARSHRAAHRRQGWANRLSRTAGALLPPANARTTVPPGHLRPGTRPLLVVASLPRSGTHLLIDAVLNNFAAYKRRPLYVNLDRLLDDESALDELVAQGSYVVKTHYPYFGASPELDARVDRVARAGRVVTTDRPVDEVQRSAHAMGLTPDTLAFGRQAARFAAFWSRYPCSVVAFRDLVDPNAYGPLVSRLGEVLGCDPPASVVTPPRRDQRLRLYAAKAATRLVGRWSPVVNTTIGVGLTDHGRPLHAAGQGAR